MVSKNNPLRDGRHLNRYCPYVEFFKRPSSEDIRHPKTGQIYSQPYYWRVSLKPNGLPPVTGVAGELWYLQDITANVANWKQLVFTGGGSPIITITGDAGGGVSADALENMDLNGLVVANQTRAKPVFFTGTPGSFKQELEVQVAADRTGAPADSNDAGIVSFDDTAFSVDPNGYVTLSGGAGPSVDTNTGDDLVGVGADGAGNFNWIGLAVASATHAKPVFFKDSATANAIDLDIQVAADRTGAPGDKLNAGLASFDDTSFNVDADGYVTLVGGPGPAVDSFTTDVGGPVVPTGAGVVDTTGTSVFSDGTVANTLTLNVQATAETFLLGAGVGSSATELGPLTNGQLIIGSTGAAPVLSTLASADASITITNGAGSIDLAVAPGSGFTWNDVTGTSDDFEAANGYITNNAGLVTITLPTTCTVGDTFRIGGLGAGGWLVAQNASQVIHIGNMDTTTGTGGSLASTNRHDCLEFLCVVTNNEYLVVSWVGNITVN